MHPQFNEACWQIIATIPKGKVATYGQIAKLTGYPNHARAVGRTLKNLPKVSTIPWHRVVNAKGALSFHVDSASYKRQKEQLQNEGIIFINERILLKNFLWQP